MSVMETLGSLLIYPGPLHQTKIPKIEKMARDTIVNVLRNCNDSRVKYGKQTRLRVICTARIKKM